MNDTLKQWSKKIRVSRSMLAGIAKEKLAREGGSGSNLKLGFDHPCAFLLRPSTTCYDPSRLVALL